MRVVCLNTGTKYTTHPYTMNLYRMLDRNSTREWNFECVTQSRHAGWWGKLELFPPKERIVFLDLDVVITGNIDWLFDYNGPFCAWEDPRPGKYNTSVMSIAPGVGKALRDKFELVPGEIKRTYYSDQEYVTAMLGVHDTWQKIAPGKVKSYKYDHLQEGPGDAAIVVFHGDPKPHAIKEGWVKEYWR